MKRNDQQLRQLIDAEATHAEATKGDPIPPEALTRATRPGLAKSTVFCLRLNPDEHAELLAAADVAGVPASTLARGWIMQRLAAGRGVPDDAALLLDRLENDVQVLRRLVAC